MKRVLVTGATGFIGRQCLPLLAADPKVEVYAVCRRPPSDARFCRTDANRVVWCAVDLLARAQKVEQLIREIRPTHLLHLAWTTEPGAYWTSLKNLAWTAASLRLVEAFLGHGGRRMVLAGTCAEYDWSSPVCREEETPLRPRTLYGGCKHALQTIVEQAGRQSSVSQAWARYFFLYGPHEHPSRLVPSVVHSLLTGGTIACSHGQQVRDYLHVHDAARATVQLLLSSVEGPVNIGAGEGTSLRAMVQCLTQTLGGESLVRWGARPSPPDDPAQLVADVRRLRDEVGWTPRFSLEEGLNDTVAWWRHRLADTSHEDSLRRAG